MTSAACPPPDCLDVCNLFLQHSRPRLRPAAGCCPEQAAAHHSQNVEFAMVDAVTNDSAPWTRAPWMGSHSPWLLHDTHRPLAPWSQLRNSPRPVSTLETSAGAAVESCVNFIVVAVDNIVPHRNIGLGDTCTTCTQWKLIIKEICTSNRNWLGVGPSLYINVTYFV